MEPYWFWKDHIDQNAVKYNVKDGKLIWFAAEQSLYRTATASNRTYLSTKTEGWTIENGKLKCYNRPDRYNLRTR